MKKKKEKTSKEKSNECNVSHGGGRVSSMMMVSSAKSIDWTGYDANIMSSHTQYNNQIMEEKNKQNKTKK